MIQFIAFIVSNFRWILIAAGSTALLGFVWQAYNVVSNNAKNEVLLIELQQDIVTLETELRNKEVIIKIQQENFDEANRLLSKRDSDVNKLRTQLNSFLNNLGTDQNDLAPQSLQELIRRLQEDRGI